MSTINAQETININMLGRFQISIGDCVISDTGSRTHQIWNLLEYLIAFRNKTISQDELIATLWPDYNSDNPANALKNLVYRLRTIFHSHDIPFAKDIIVFNRGTYRWNNNLRCTVDTEEFEKLYRRSTEPLLSSAQKVDCCRKAIALYVGNFLPDSCYEEWVVPLVGYYRSIYFKCVSKGVELLLKENLYDEIISICQKAIIIDPFDELPHKYLILSFARQNNHSAALKHYNYVTDLFYRELGVKPSENMRNLYREIVKSINSVETDLEIIKDDLSEHSIIDGTYYCDYEVFKNLYRVEARTAARTGQSVFVGLLTLTDINNQVPETGLLSDVMDQLLRSVKQSLRKGDIASRFSATQYVLMFSSFTLDKGRNVMNRVCANFNADCTNKTIKLHSEIRPLDPVK
ncbi:MAG: BTAD domain-containing putative transcriptional regulator [Oscillospiraceae bacterium]